MSSELLTHEDSPAWRVLALLRWLLLLALLWLMMLA